MAFSKLTCPECDTVLRPAKPVAAGKKVRCPKCSTVFAAGEDEVDEVDEVEEVRPRKSAAKASKGKPAVKEPAKKKEEAKKPGGDDDGEGTYGYIKEDDEEDEEAKEAKKIDYLAMTKSRDLRGPAIVKIATPASKLQMVGLAGALGWFAFLLVIVILVVFPVKEDDDKIKALAEKTKTQPHDYAKVEKVDKQQQSLSLHFVGADKPEPFSVQGVPLKGGNGDPTTLDGGEFRRGRYVHVTKQAGAVQEVRAVKMDGMTFAVLYGMNFTEEFAYVLIVSILGLIYSGAVTAGAIKTATLESRTWGMTGSILALLPFHAAGLAAFIGLWVQFGLGMVIDDRSFIEMIVGGIGVILYLISLGVGAWNIVVLNDEEVKTGFEFEPDQT